MMVERDRTIQLLAAQLTCECGPTCPLYEYLGNPPCESAMDEEGSCVKHVMEWARKEVERQHHTCYTCRFDRKRLPICLNCDKDICDKWEPNGRITEKTVEPYHTAEFPGMGSCRICNVCSNITKNDEPICARCSKQTKGNDEHDEC